MLDFFSATLRYAVQLLTPAAIQVTKYSWIIYMPRWMNMICWYYLLNPKLIHLQAKICGRSNIVKDDIRWYIFFFLSKSIDLFIRRKAFPFQGHDWAVHGRQEQCNDAAGEQCQVHAVIQPRVTFQWRLHPYQTSHLRCLPLSTQLPKPVSGDTPETPGGINGSYLCANIYNCWIWQKTSSCSICFISWLSWDQDQHYVLHYSSE